MSLTRWKVCHLGVLWVLFNNNNNNGDVDNDNNNWAGEEESDLSQIISEPL